jgi:hypothetical protein
VTAYIQWESKLPYYVQLKQILVKQIEQGELRPGDLLPTGKVRAIGGSFPKVPLRPLAPLGRAAQLADVAARDALQRIRRALRHDDAHQVVAILGVVGRPSACRRRLVLSALDRLGLAGVVVDHQGGGGS